MLLLIVYPWVPVDIHVDILRATPSGAGPFWLLGAAIWEAWCLLFDIPGAHFGTSGVPWEAIFAHRGRGTSRMDSKW